MPLSDEDYVDILKHLQRRLQEYAPDIFEHLGSMQDIQGSPRERLIRYFQYAIGMFKEQSSSSYPDILELLNRYIETRDGSNIDGIQIVFSPEEREMYGIGEVDLGSLPDRSDLIDSLLSIMDVVTKDRSDSTEIL
jgi:hypothetical protein